MTPDSDRFERNETAPAPLRSTSESRDPRPGDDPGARLFGTAATPLIAIADRYGHRSAVAYVTLPAADLAALGNATIQDAVLAHVQSRLVELHRTSDLVARAGVNSFAILLSHLWDPEGCYAAARRLASEMARPYEIGHRVFRVTARIGMAVRPEDGDSLSVLVAMAVGASVEADETGVPLRFANRYLGEELERRDVMERSLSSSPHLSQFALDYQPIFSLATLAPVGIEALIRWDHPTLGLLSAAEFVPEAERSGRIRSFDRWVASEAIGQASRRHDWDGWVSINLSAHSIADSGMVDHLRHMVTADNLGRTRTVVEVTESAALSNPRETLRVIDALREHDIIVAVDDFGTGYSSLEYVSMFKADLIKLDRTFVLGTEDSSRKRRLLTGLINMCHHMGTPVVAEGVENSEQQDILTEAGCDMVQGFHLGRPMPFDTLIPQLQQR